MMMVSRHSKESRRACSSRVLYCMLRLYFSGFDRKLQILGSRMWFLLRSRVAYTSLCTDTGVHTMWQHCGIQNRRQYVDVRFRWYVVSYRFSGTTQIRHRAKLFGLSQRPPGLLMSYLSPIFYLGIGCSMTKLNPPSCCRGLLRSTALVEEHIPSTGMAGAGRQWRK